MASIDVSEIDNIIDTFYIISSTPSTISSTSSSFIEKPSLTQVYQNTSDYIIVFSSQFDASSNVESSTSEPYSTTSTDFILSSNAKPSEKTESTDRLSSIISSFSPLLMFSSTPYDDNDNKTTGGIDGSYSTTSSLMTSYHMTTSKTDDSILISESTSSKLTQVR